MNALDSHLSTLGGEPSSPAATPLPVLPGYAVEALVGRGGMGKVYRARHLGLGRVVAVKVLALDPDERTLARFADEARAVAKLQHPHIAQVFDTGTADGRPFFAQEFLDGGSLAQKFAGAPQDPKYAAEVVEIVARAIQHSHDHGILHRDLKPGNILLAANGTPKVTDFGLAKEIPGTGDTPVESGGGLTRTGEILGTPAYMPPEQASGVFAGIGPAADVYSLGAILYEAVTGRPPFQAPDALQTLFMVLGMDPVPPRTLQPTLPKDLETVCLKCLEKSPRRRYPSAVALADDLRRFRAGEPILARPVGFVERVGKWARRKKAAAALLAVSVLFVVAVIGGAIRLAVSNGRIREANARLESANAELEKSRGETEGMLGYALGTMDEYHFTLSDKLAELPQGEKLRVEVLKQARDTLDGLYALNPNREKVWEFMRTGYDRLGNALGQVGDLDASVAAHRRAADVSARLVAAHPEEAGHRSARGLTLVKLATTLGALGKDADATAAREEGVALAADLDRTHPDDPQVIALNVLAAPFVHREARTTGQPRLIVPLYRRWIELQRRLVRVQPDVPRHRTKLLEHELSLAKVLANLKEYAEAEAILTGAKATVNELPAGPTSAVRFARAGYHEAVAGLAYFREQWSAADAAYRKALSEYEALAKDFPNSPNYRQCLVNIWRNLAMVGLYGTDKPGGITALRTARDFAAALARDFPDNAQYKDSLAFLADFLKAAETPEPKK